MTAAPQGQDILALIERLRHPDWNQSEQDEALIALAAQQAEIARLQSQYHELIMAVGMKWPGESRHETALKYIRRAEQPVAGEGTAKQSAALAEPGS